MTDRRERVILQLQDEFSAGMAKAAAETAVLNEELKTLDGRTAEVDQAGKRLAADDGGLGQTKKKLGEADKAAQDANSGMGLLATTIIGLGPALIPATAGVVPVLTAMSAGMASVAGGAGVTVLAFKGMGNAIAAVNTAQLNPTTANIRAAHTALANLAPAAANFAQYIVGLEPTLTKMQQVAGQNLFPGLQAGIEGILPVLPEVNQLIANLAAEMGKLSAEAGQGIGGPQGQQFLRFLDASAAPTLDLFAKAFGNLALGVASMFQAFQPLNTTFLHGLDDMTAGFARWAQGLSQSTGFHDFVAYLEQEGPAVLHLLGTFTETVLSIAQAFAPWGSVLIPILTDVLKLLGALANSPLGPFIAAAISLGVVGAKGFNLMKVGVDGLTKSLIEMGVVAKVATTAISDGAEKTAVATAYYQDASGRWHGANGKFVSESLALQAAADGDAAALRGEAEAADAAAAATAAASETNAAASGGFLASRGLQAGENIGLIGLLGKIGLITAAASIVGNTTNGFGFNTVMSQQTGGSGGLDPNSLMHLANGLQTVDNNLENIGGPLQFGGGTLNTLGNLGGSVASIFGVTNPYANERSNLTSVDQQLAQMVQMGDATKAQATFQQFATDANQKWGLSVDQVNQLLPNYTNAINAVNDAAANAATSIQGLTSAQHQNATAALQAFNAETSYGNALQALQKQAGSGAGAGENIFTKSGTGNRTALANFAATWNNESAAVQNNVKRYHEAASQMATYARQMGLSRQQIAQAVEWLNKPQAVFKAQQQTADANNFWSGIFSGKISGFSALVKSQGNSTLTLGGRVATAPAPNSFAPVVQAQATAAKQIAAAQEAAALKTVALLNPGLAAIVSAVLARSSITVDIGGQSFNAVIQQQAQAVINNNASRKGGPH